MKTHRSGAERVKVPTTAHELAKLLLAGPDLPVAVRYWPEMDLGPAGRPRMARVVAVPGVGGGWEEVGGGRAGAPFGVVVVDDEAEG